MPPALPPFADPSHQIALVVGRGDKGDETIKRPKTRIGCDDLTDGSVEADGLGGLKGS